MGVVVDHGEAVNLRLLRIVQAEHDRVASHAPPKEDPLARHPPDRKSTRLNSSHLGISYAVFCLKKKLKKRHTRGKNQNVSRLIALTRWRSSADFFFYVVRPPEQNPLILNVSRILL